MENFNEQCFHLVFILHNYNPTKSTWSAVYRENYSETQNAKFRIQSNKRAIFDRVNDSQKRQYISITETGRQIFNCCNESSFA